MQITLLVLCFLVNLIKGCDEKCIQCNTDLNLNEYKNCLKCIDGYQYDYLTSSCLPIQRCEQFQFLEQNDNNQQSCVSICKQNTIGFIQNQTCIQPYQCSIQYTQQSQISQGRDISDIQVIDKDNLFTIYSNFVNLISINDGQLLRQYKFDQKFIKIKICQQKLYLFSFDREVYTWSIQNGNPQFLASFKNGVINSKLDLISVFNNQQILMVTSYNDQLKQIILTQINQNMNNEIKIQYQRYVYTQNNTIIFQDAQNQIMLARIEQALDLQLFVNYIIKTPICQNIQGEFRQIKELTTNSKYLLTFANTKGFYMISTETQTCQIYTEDSFLIKMDLFQINFSALISKNYICISFQSNIFKIYDGINNQSIITQKFENQIVDFGIVFLSVSQIKIYFLKSNNKIDIYQLQYSNNNIDQTSSLVFVTSVGSYISNPLRLLVLNQIQPAIQTGKLCIISQDIQIVNINNDTNNGLIIDFKEKTAVHEQKVNQIYLAEDINLLLSCSDDGKVVVWNYADIYQPRFFYNLYNPGQSCTNIAVYQNLIAIIQFKNQLVLFNIFNKYIIQKIDIDLTFSFIQTTINYIYLVFNQKIMIMQNFQEIFSYQLNQNIQNIFIPSWNDIYIYDQSNKISGYYMDITSKKFLPIINQSPFECPQNIKYMNLFEIGEKDKKLKQFFSTDGIGSIIHGYQFDVTQYFFLLNAPNKNKSNPIAVQYFSMTSKVFADITQVPQSNKLYNVRSMMMFGKEYLWLNSNMPFSFASLTTEGMWSKDNEFYSTQSIFTEGNVVTSEITNKQKEIQYIGTESGVIQFVNYQKKGIPKIFTLQQNSNDDKIYQMKSSFILGYYYIITKQTIYIYYLYNDLLALQKTLSPISNNSEYILNFYISEKYGIIIAFTKAQIFIRNDFNSKENTLKINDPNQIIKSIVGLYFDEKIQLIYIFGNILAQTDIQLQNIKKLSQTQSSEFISCQFFEKVSVCKHNINNVSFYNRQSSFSLIQILEFSPPYKQDFQILSDETYENIFIFSNIIDIYNFSGVYKATLPQITQDVFQIEIAGKYFVVLTKPSILLNILFLKPNFIKKKNKNFSTSVLIQFLHFFLQITFNISYIKTIYIFKLVKLIGLILKNFNKNVLKILFLYKAAFIYERDTLILKIQFNPSGGTLTRGVYLKEINVLTYFTNEIRYGQIKLYSLDSFTPSSILSSFPLNKIGFLVNLVYDPDSVVINFLDTYGNFIQQRYGQQSFADSTLGITEIQNLMTTQPTDYFIDFNLNEVFVYNDNYAWRINYNRLTRSFESFHKIEKQFFFTILQNPKSSYNENIQIFYTDIQNNIYFNDQTKTIFIKKFNENIQEIKDFQYNNEQIQLIVFSNKIQVFIGQSIDLISLNFKYEITNIKLQQFLITEQSKIVFQTYENEIIDYNFITNQKNFSFKLDQNLYIQCYVSISDNEKKIYWYLYMVLSSKFIVKYDILKQNYSPIAPINQTDLIIKLISISQNIIVLSMTSGNVFEVNSSDFSLLSNQQLNKKISSILLPSNQVEGFQNTLVEYQSQNQRMFVSIANTKYATVYNTLDNYSIIKVLYFPDYSYKKLYLTENSIMLTCSFQINIYSNNLQYVGRIRRGNRQVQIKNVIEIFSNVFIILYISALETIVVNNEINFIKSVNYISLSDPKLIYFQNKISSDIIQIIGISKTGIFNQKLSLSYIYQQGKITSNQMQINNNIKNRCTSDITYTSQFQAANDFDNIYNFQYNHDISYTLSVLIYKEINNMNFFSKKNIDVYMRPYSMQDKLLYIKEKSFQNVPYNVFMNDFSFIYNEKGKSIYFHSMTKNVTLQSIQISNQVLQDGTQLIFQNMENIQIKGLNITNINLIDTQQSQRHLETTNQQLTNSLLKFQNCSYILIESLIVSNLIQISQTFSLISASNIQTFIIKNIIIQNSKMNNNLIFLSKINTLRIDEFIIQSCQRYNIDTTSVIIKQLIFLEGIQSLRIQSLKAQDNLEIAIMKCIDIYEDESTKYSLKNAALIIKDSQIVNNQFPQLFNIDQQINLIDLQTSQIFLENVEFNRNQANIVLRNSDFVIVDNSSFMNNQGVIGGAIQFINISGKTVIDNSRFEYNTVKAYGGSIYFQDVNDLFITSSCKFINNSALIGGAIRILITEIKLQESMKSKIQSHFSENKADIFGKDVASFPSKILIYQSSDELYNNKVLKYNGNINSNVNGLIHLDDVQSGNKVYLLIQLQDDTGFTMKIDSEKYQNKLYPQPIIIELERYSMEVTFQGSMKEIEISGETLITIRQYISDKQSFSFNNLIIGGYPNRTGKSLIFKINMNTWQKATIINVNIHFRKCEIGEIPLYLSQSVIYCKECQQGTYSMIDPNVSTQDEEQTNNQENQLDNSIQCKKCPVGTLSCEKDQLVLKNGYWRENNQSDSIIKCFSQSQPTCYAEDSNNRFGCYEGHIGPLCETCDVFGDIWDHSYIELFGVQQCIQCSNNGVQSLYIVIIFIISIAYLCISIYIFLKNFQLNSVCTYLRLLKMVPLSKSCIQDESTFIIKSLLSYLQIQSILCNLNVNILPDIFTYVPSFFGQPVQKIAVSFSCFFPYVSEIVQTKDIVKLTFIFYSLVPLILFIIVLLFYGILRKTKQRMRKPTKINSYYYYMVINNVFFFFQPDQINYLTSSLVCRTIGNKQYVKNNLTMLCDNQSYQNFRLYAIVPFLIFWIVFPIFFLIKLIMDKKSSDCLQYCTMKFKYGYFFLEYKDKYFYWEFVRVYLKITLVLVATLLDQQEFIKILLCFIIITLYMYMTYNVQPFQSKQLSRIEESSYFILICNTLFFQLYDKLQIVLFGVLLMIIHNGFIFLYFTFILKMKVFKKIQQQNKIVMRIVSCLLPKGLYSLIISRSQLRLKTLFYWKKIYSNLIQLREQKNIENQKKLEQTQIMESSPKSKQIVKDILKHKKPNEAQLQTKTSQFIMSFSQNLQACQMSHSGDYSPFYFKEHEGSPSNTLIHPPFVNNIDDSVNQHDFSKILCRNKRVFSKNISIASE